MTQEALKLALDFIEDVNFGEWRGSTERQEKVITAIKEALAQRTEQDIAALVTGMEVSIDVSTGDHDSGNRLFGVVDLVQENQGSKHGLILLVQEPKANFKEALAQPEQWGASAVTHPEYVAEQKRKTEELRSMLTQPKQESVVCCQQYDTCLQPCTPRGEHLAQRTWVGLTDEEVNAATPVIEEQILIRVIEAELKGLNT